MSLYGGRAVRFFKGRPCAGAHREVSENRDWKVAFNGPAQHGCVSPAKGCFVTSSHERGFTEKKEYYQNKKAWDFFFEEAQTAEDEYAILFDDPDHSEEEDRFD
ncbi:MAG: hypothetical protein ACLU48_01995 [Clostridiaceae bacterium]